MVNRKSKTPERPAGEEPISLRRGPIDVPFAVLVIVLLAIGLITVLSSSFATAYYEKTRPTYYFTHQGIFAMIGLVAMFAVTLVPRKFIEDWTPLGYAASIVLLILVLLVGQTINGAKRWLGVGDRTIQPSEVAKLGMILMLAWMASARQKAMKTFQTFCIMLGILLIVAGLVIAEKHISATIILLTVGVVMMFLSGCSLLLLGLLGAAGGAGLYLIITKTGYATDRINAWLEPEAYRLSGGWQILQSQYAIGSGGFFGVGIGQSRQKYLYLPEESNDYIFSVFCEEMGYVGAILLLLLFSLLIIRGFWLAIHARHRFSSLVISGITTLIAAEVILNVLVVTNTFPPTGISLPFFSYGGTALALQLFEMGIILNLSRDIPLRRVGRRQVEASV